MIELDFIVKGYPRTGRKIEEEGELAYVSRPDLIQGAFMGDAVLRLHGVDFSTNFGWVTLLDWCLSLTVAVKSLEFTDSTAFTFSESDDYLEFRLRSGEVTVACSYSPLIAKADFQDLKVAVEGFVDRWLDWIVREFPDALRNKAMPDVYMRLGRPFPSAPDGSST
ncbi:hypothetical protein GCM10010109_54220 [Actinoplanes campanulatus]|nr:hypothetical protein GCM10010109_54220 [Actinoplanes campanulatus]GID38197.1 hypothetical protein Aca09nite_47030 [Actinoplanes campanulatus]